MRFAAFFALALLSVVAAAPTPTQVNYEDLNLRSDSTYDYSAPRSTPRYIPPPPAEILPFDQLQNLVGAATGFSVDSDLAQEIENIFGSVLDSFLHIKNLKDKRAMCGFFGIPCPTTSKTSTTKTTTTSTSRVATSSIKTTSTSTKTTSTAKPSPTPTCLGSSNSEKQINSLFSLGGANTTVFLCPGATITTTNPIQFTAPYQTLTTQGDPTGSTRAIIVGTGKSQTNVVTGNCAYCDGITLKSVQINGNRAQLGYVSRDVNGNALIEMGGTNRNGVIDNINAYDTRGWSCNHVIEGDNNYCTGMSITNSQFSNCGMAPSAGQPQAKRATTSVVPPGQWADGISLACANSVVANNVITDATDGGLVIFGSPGSIIKNNKIIASTRQLMGGINAVDFGPWSGNYTGTVVSNNAIVSEGAMIKVGLAVGTLTWGSMDDPSFRVFGAKFVDNVLSSGSTGYFSFGVAAAGVNSTEITGTTFNKVNFGGVSSSKCLPDYLPPKAGPLYWDPSTSVNMTLQPSFNGSTFLVFVICEGPSTPTIKGYSA